MTDELDKHYLKILKLVDDDLKNKNFDHAISLLEDELDAPYMPEKYIEKFESKLLDVKFEQNYNTEYSKYANFSKSDFLKRIKNNDVDSQYLVCVFFEKYNKNIDNEDIQAIKEIISDKKIFNEIKILIIEQLKYNGYNDIEFDYYNNWTKEKFLFKVSDFKSVEEHDFYKGITNGLTEILRKDPLTLEFCYNIEISIYASYFPNLNIDDIFDKLELVKSIFEVVHDMMHDNKTTKSKHYDDVLKIVNNMKN